MKQISGFYDIAVPILAERGTVFQWMMICLVFTLLIGLSMIWYRNKRQEHEASSREDHGIYHSYGIEEIEALWKAGNWGDRRTAYFIANVLVRSLDIKSLDSTCPPSLQADSRQWNELVQLLNALRYQKDINKGLQARHFEYLKQWLA